MKGDRLFVTIELHQQLLAPAEDIKACRLAIESVLRKHLKTEISWDAKMTDNKEIVFYTGKLESDIKARIVEKTLTRIRETYQDNIKVIWKMSEV